MAKYYKVLFDIMGALQVEIVKSGYVHFDKMAQQEGITAISTTLLKLVHQMCLLKLDFIKH